MVNMALSASPFFSPFRARAWLLSLTSGHDFPSLMSCFPFSMAATRALTLFSPYSPQETSMTRHKNEIMQLAEIKERRVQLTVRGGVVVAGAHEAPRGQPRHQLARVALVDALTLGQCIQLVKHLKETRTRLMDGAHDGAPSAAQVFQQLDALVA